MSEEQVPFWDAAVAENVSALPPIPHCGGAARASQLLTQHGRSWSGFWALGTGRVRAASNLEGRGDEDDRLSLALPKPIPGGVSAFGILIHHFPVPPPGTQLANLTDPLRITDFRGFIGNTSIRGAGVGISNGVEMPLAFKADMGFMKGEYIGQDGRHHHNTFGFL